MKFKFVVILFLVVVTLTTLTDSGASAALSKRATIDNGRYLVTIAGCNDCHTANWAETNGQVEEKDWLTGVPVGWRGPWGTTYASNLRQLVNDMDENAWVAMLKTRQGLPPMPWMNVKKLSEDDSRAIYRYIASLGIAGERMPVAVPPGAEPATPYFLLDPVIPE